MFITHVRRSHAPDPRPRSHSQITPTDTATVPATHPPHKHTSYARQSVTLTSHEPAHLVSQARMRSRSLAHCTLGVHTTTVDSGHTQTHTQLVQRAIYRPTTHVGSMLLEVAGSDAGAMRQACRWSVYTAAAYSCPYQFTKPLPAASPARGACALACCFLFPALEMPSRRRSSTQARAESS